MTKTEKIKFIETIIGAKDLNIIDVIKYINTTTGHVITTDGIGIYNTIEEYAPYGCIEVVDDEIGQINETSYMLEDQDDELIEDLMRFIATRNDNQQI